MKCPEGEGGGWYQVQVTLAFLPGDQGGTKLAGSQPRCHSFLPAKKSSCCLCTETAVSDPRHRPHSPAAPGTHCPHPKVPGAALEAQHLRGRGRTSHKKRPGKQSCSAEPNPIGTGSHLLLLNTQDPKGEGHNFCSCANFRKREKQCEELNNFDLASFFLNLLEQCSLDPHKPHPCTPLPLCWN